MRLDQPVEGAVEKSTKPLSASSLLFAVFASVFCLLLLVPPTSSSAYEPALIQETELLRARRQRLDTDFCLGIFLLIEYSDRFRAHLPQMNPQAFQDTRCDAFPFPH
jgi:hypothetical protein